MKKKIKFVVAKTLWLCGKVYPYGMSQRMSGYRNILYTMWIRNFLGEMGEGSAIGYPCSLQGGGHRFVRIGCHTVIQSHGILGCWERYHAMEANGNELEQRFEPEIVIGNYCSVGEYTQITAIDKITIGDGLLTGRYVYIGDNIHGGLSWNDAIIQPSRRQLTSKGEVRIGRNVWLGDKVSILAGVHIGDNVIIGANSVVTHDIPSNTMAAGVPARVIRKLNAEKCQTQD